MVDYPSRPSNIDENRGPRCGAHRDFGTITIIFPDDTSGLEVLLDEKKEVWRPLDVSSGSAILLFGWCANIRSNDRVPAALHRVVDAPGQNGIVPRRISAVFYVAPSSNTALSPNLMFEVMNFILKSKVRFN